jgi:hypothetical protein
LWRPVCVAKKSLTCLLHRSQCLFQVQDACQSFLRVSPVFLRGGWHRKTVFELQLGTVPERNSNSRCRRADRHNLALGDAVAFEVTVKAGAADAKNMRGSQPIAFAHLEYPLDVNLADFFE